MQPAGLREMTDAVLGAGPSLFSKVFGAIGRRTKRGDEAAERSAWDRVVI